MPSRFLFYVSAFALCAVFTALSAGETLPVPPPKPEPVAPFAPVAPAKPAPAPAEIEWEKIETKFVPIVPRQVLSPGLYDRTLMSIIAFQPPPVAAVPGNPPPQVPPVPPAPFPPPELKLPRFGLDKNGKPHTPFIARFAQDFIWVDFDADNKPNSDESKHVGTDGLSDAYNCELFYDNGTSGKYAFRFKTISEKNQYAVIRACGRQFEYKGKRVTLLDDDGNGKYNDVGRDAVWVDGQPVCFLGKYILIGEALVEIVVQQSGATVEVRPAPKDIQVGAIAAFDKFEPTQKADSLKVHTIIFSGPEGSFACDDTHRLVTVPVGVYDMVFGLFERKNETIFMKKGEKTSFSVMPKTTSAPKWGGKVVAKYSMTSDGEEFTVSAPRFFGIGTEEYIPEYGHANICSAKAAMVFKDRTHFDIDSFVPFGSKRYDLLPNLEFKPIIFKRYRTTNDEYEVDVDYTSGIIGRVEGKQRMSFVYKKKDPKAK